MLMTYVAAENYLKANGKFGFVITQTVFKTSGAAQGFRKFTTRSKVPLGVSWVDDFSEMQLFEGAVNRTAVFIMRKGEQTKYPVQYAYWRKRADGRIGRFDYGANLEEVIGKTERLQFVAEPVNEADLTSPWVTGRPKVLRTLARLKRHSPYRERAHQGVNTGGANAIYWFELIRDHRDGTVTAANITDGAKRKIDSVQVKLERDLLHPLLRGRDVTRWRAVPSAYLLFVQDPIKRRGIDEADLKSNYPLAYAWLEKNRKDLENRSAFKRYFESGRDAFYTMFDVGEYTLAPWRVAWRRVANELDVSVINASGEPRTLSDSTLVEITCDNKLEAYFVAGVMNSTLYRLAVASYIALHPDIHILSNLYVPKFDSAMPLHKSISAEAQRLSDGAADMKEPTHTKLDQLCSQIWGIDQSSLKAVQDADRELYGKVDEQSLAEGKE